MGRACERQTTQFRELVASSSRHGPTKPKTQASDPWTNEARKILVSSVNLYLFLKSIRRAYLDTSYAAKQASNRRPASRYDITADSDKPSDSNSPFDMWSKLKYLTDKERDEIDLTAKGMLRQLMHSIDALKVADEARIKQFAQRSVSRVFKNNSTAQSASRQLSAHRSAIVLYLQSTLAVVSTEHKDQQEGRIRKQLERNPDLRHLAGNLSYGKDVMSAKGQALAEGSKGSKYSSPSMLTPNAYANETLSKAQQMAQSAPATYAADDDDVDALLTPQQIQQFEEEQSALLKQHQSTLSSIRTAEASLLEISALQSELVVHLTQQNEITNKLWEDSLYVSGRVEEGNKQLIQARERNKEGRVWLLVFLIGASLTLLFLDSY